LSHGGKNPEILYGDSAWKMGGPHASFPTGDCPQITSIYANFFYFSKGLLLRFQSSRLLKESPKVKNEHFISFYSRIFFPMPTQVKNFEV
jgi:hypothetical protein